MVLYTFPPDSHRRYFWTWRKQMHFLLFIYFSPYIYIYIYCSLNTWLIFSIKKKTKFQFFKNRNLIIMLTLKIDQTQVRNIKLKSQRIFEFYSKRTHMSKNLQQRKILNIFYVSTSTWLKSCYYCKEKKTIKGKMGIEKLTLNMRNQRESLHGSHK